MAVARALQSVVRAAQATLLPARGADQADQAQQAWLELEEHPALTWVPPLWRPDDDSPAALDAARRHTLSSMQANLRVDVLASEGGVSVRLVTGPLIDRETPSGVNPLRPSSVPADLSAEAATFEDAVLRLRDLVRHRYPAEPGTTR